MIDSTARLIDGTLRVRTGLRVGGANLGGVAGGVVPTPTIAGIPAGILAGGAICAELGELGAEYLEGPPGRRALNQRKYRKPR